MSQQDVVSFMLRFVREANETEQARWRGLIHHVQSDNQEPFTEFAQALAFMQANINETVQAAFSSKDAPMSDTPDNNNPFMETARLWGAFMPQYNQALLDTMQEMMAAGAAMPQQMNNMMGQMMSGWSGNPQEQQQLLTQLAQQVDQLTAQVAVLNQRLTELENQK
ncbi:MAG TPA: hypothetical protein VLL52_03595 [Anaerolineae bacterium]|nr:hypothetical protein [Anaerolineae bacterium]